jgi:hypothetical protein
MLDIILKKIIFNNNKMTLPLTVFMCALFILGLILVISSIRVDTQLRESCKSEKLRNYNTIILAIGIIFMVSSISFLICRTRCNCGKSDSADAMIYAVFSIVLGIFLIFLGATVHSESNSQNCTDGASHASLVWIIGLLMTLVSSGYIGYTYKISMNTAKHGFGFRYK